MLIRPKFKQRLIVEQFQGNYLNFNRNTKFSSVSWKERAALQNLSKREDIIVKAADKGGALVDWRADLYQKEALRVVF